MVEDSLLPVFDLVGAGGFLIGMYFGVKNYRDTDVERPFWLAFSFTAGLGALWLVVVAIEWAASEAALLDPLSTSLQAVVIGLVAVGVVGTFAVVEDLRQSRMETDQRASIVSVLSRVLRHNLRNDLNVISGYTELYRDEIAEVDIIQRKIDSLVKTSEKVRKIEQSAATGELGRLDLDKSLRRIAATVRDEHPAAVITVDASPGVTVWAMPSLETALRELLENAVQHTGESPVVDIAVEVTGATVAIHFRDRGPGLPEQERTLLHERIETQLHHSSGIGLWMAQWIVKSHDGELRADVTDEGTTFTVELPANRNRPRERNSDSTRATDIPERYHEVFETHVDAMLILDDDHRILDANRTAVTRFDRHRTELLGRRLGDITPEGCTFEPDWEAWESNTVYRGTAPLLPTDPPGQSVEYVARPAVLSGEHLLVVRDSP